MSRFHTHISVESSTFEMISQKFVVITYFLAGICYACELLKFKSKSLLIPDMALSVNVWIIVPVQCDSIHGKCNYVILQRLNNIVLA